MVDSQLSIGSVYVGATTSQVIAAYQQGVEHSAGEVRQLSGRLGIAESAIAGFLATLEEAQVPIEQVPAKFQELANRYQHLLESVRTLQSADPEVQALKGEAAAAIEAGPGTYNRAEELLARAEVIDRQATERLAVALDERSLNAAATRAQRGELSLVRLDYPAAIAHFSVATEIVPRSHPEVRLRYRSTYANALYEYGQQMGINRALEAAIEVQESMLQEYTRERVPLDWAMTQNNLGNALSRLGERESRTARLKQAVEAYRAALQVYTRERLPLDWATTQNNLGSTLSRLGERESGTARLKEAVEAYRAALLERTRARAPLQWATTQNNLGNALLSLGSASRGRRD